MKERVLEIVVGPSTCLTVAYGAATFNGYYAYNRLIMLVLISPLLVVVLWQLFVKTLFWLGFQLGHLDDRK